MPNPNYTLPQKEYDPRWFIWTIVFLVVTGISLVSYIVFSDSGANDAPGFSIHRVSAVKNPTQSVKK